MKLLYLHYFLPEGKKKKKKLFREMKKLNEVLNSSL